MTLFEIIVEHLVHKLGVDLELLAELGIAVVAFCLQEVLDTLLDLGEAEVIAEVVTFEEGTEVDTYEVCDAVLLGLL